MRRGFREFLGPKTPIIRFSAYDWTEIEKEALAVGVMGFLIKPLFKIDLPVFFKKLCQWDEDREVAQPALFETPDFSSRRILLGEDNELNIEIALKLLSLTSIAVETTWNGAEAVEKIQTASPDRYDMVITDIPIPVMNGYEAAAAIRTLEREDTKTLPVIAMTADVFSADLERAIKLRQYGMHTRDFLQPEKADKSLFFE